MLCIYLKAKFTFRILRFLGALHLKMAARGLGCMPAGTLACTLKLQPYSPLKIALPCPPLGLRGAHSGMVCLSIRGDDAGSGNGEGMGDSASPAHRLEVKGEVQPTYSFLTHSWRRASVESSR